MRRLYAKQAGSFRLQLQWPCLGLWARGRAPQAPAASNSADSNDLRWDLAKAFQFDWGSAEFSAKSTEEGTLTPPCARS